MNNIDKLSELIHRWREDRLVKVVSSNILPDCTNRERTGLSLEHVHYLATTFTTEGFRKRTNNEGHDIPVLVRENHSTGSTLYVPTTWFQGRVAEFKLVTHTKCS